jgi:16S rRNA processing protein RimM
MGPGSTSVVSGQETPRFLVIGEVLRPQGVKGEVRVRVLTDFPEHFHMLERVYVGQGPSVEVVESARFHNGYVLIKLAGYDDRTAAGSLRGALLQIPTEEAMALGEDEYYHHQIVGLAVWTVEGEHLGHVREILTTGANDVYVVWGLKGEVLLPAITDVIRQVDLEAGRLIVALMEGLM